MESNINSTLSDAMTTLSKMPKIDIKGKQYASVASRVEAFRVHFPTASIETVLVHDDEQRVVIQAKIRIKENLISTGYAEEFRGDGWINATSALENAETSAIGRSLSAFGLSGSEYASANEVSNAVQQQQKFQNNNSNNSQDRATTPPQNNAPLYQNNNTEQRVHELGLGIEQLSDGTLAITGNSYPYAAELKKLKCRWQPQLKQWVLPYQQEQGRAA